MAPRLRNILRKTVAGTLAASSLFFPSSNASSPRPPATLIEHEIRQGRTGFEKNEVRQEVIDELKKRGVDRAAEKLKGVKRIIERQGKAWLVYQNQLIAREIDALGEMPAKKIEKYVGSFSRSIRRHSLDELEFNRFALGNALKIVSSNAGKIPFKQLEEKYEKVADAYRSMIKAVELEISKKESEINRQKIKALLESGDKNSGNRGIFERGKFSPKIQRFVPKQRPVRTQHRQGRQDK